MRMHNAHACARRSIAALLMLGFTAITACNDLLAVDNPGNVPEDALSDPALMPALEAAAIGTFQCGAVNFAATAGMLAGEYWSANGFVNNHPWEWRGVAEIKANPGSCNYGRNSTFMGFYTPLQQARFQLEDAFTRIEAFTDADVPNRAKMLTELRAYAGYTYTLLGEGMCDMAIDRGPRMTGAEVLAIAEERFSDAITRATALGDNDLLNMALVGRARVRLDLGNLTGAAADARNVTADYVKNATFSEATQARENRIYDLNIRSDFLSVAPAYQNLTVMLVGGTQPAPDPRVPVQDMGRNASDGVTRWWQQRKFATNASVALPIASWAEAQLILAEAVGQSAEGLAAINAVRAKKNIAPLVVNPGDDWTTLVLEERRRQLFSEGQRYVDMLRYQLPFQSGVNRKGQTYSDLTCVPLPDIETQNNPNL